MSAKITTDRAWWTDYEVRAGGDGKVGIYLRCANIRLATFNVNTAACQTRLKLLFDRAFAPPPKRRPRKLPRNTGAFSGDVGDQGFRALRLVKRPR